MASRCAGSVLRNCFRQPPQGFLGLAAAASVRQCRSAPSVGATGTRLPGWQGAQRRFLCQSTTSGGGGGSGGGGKPVSMGGSGGSEGESNGFVSWYMKCLAANPLLTKAITCALLNALGDILSQLLIEGGPIKPRRVATFTFMGLCLVGPTLHFWYSALNAWVPARNSTGVIVQLLLDQFVFAPAFLATFLSVLLTIEGKPELIKPKLKQDWWEAVKVNWVLWIPAQYLNFRFVPPNLQVLTVNIVALVWNAYMSFQSHKVVEMPAGTAAVAAPAAAAPAKSGRK